jgi:hypothetical protein
VQDQDQNLDQEFIPESVNQFIFSTHKILVDSSLKSLQNPETAKRYAKRIINRVVGDEAEVSSIKVKMPSIISKSLAKLSKKTPQARLYVVTKF